MGITFGMEFVEVSQEDTNAIMHYVADCLRRQEGDKSAAEKSQDERRRYPRVDPLPSDGVRLRLRLEPGNGPLELEPINISAGGVRFRCGNEHRVTPGVELEGISLHLPEATIECKGRIVYVSKEEV